VDGFQAGSSHFDTNRRFRAQNRSASDRSVGTLQQPVPLFPPSVSVLSCIVRDRTKLLLRVGLGVLFAVDLLLVGAAVFGVTARWADVKWTDAAQAFAGVALALALISQHTLNIISRQSDHMKGQLDAAMIHTAATT
jgi:hypothetical protein